MINRTLFACDIAYQVDLPASTRLPHQGLGVVMHPNTRIGMYCRIYQNTTFGANGKDGHGDDAPTIGNNVVIGAGAVIIGGITIGDNVMIGANSVVLESIPSNVTVVGIPAKIVKKQK